MNAQPRSAVAISKAVTTPSTAVPLSSTRIYASSLFLMAKKAASDNTGNVFIGASGLDQGVDEGIELRPGDYWEPYIKDSEKIDLSTVYIDADTAADGVVGFYTKA